MSLSGKDIQKIYLFKVQKKFFFCKSPSVYEKQNKDYALNIYQTIKSRIKYLGGGRGGGETAGNIFFYGWLVGKVFRLYGSLVFDQF